MPLLIKTRYGIIEKLNERDRSIILTYIKSDYNLKETINSFKGKHSHATIKLVLTDYGYEINTNIPSYGLPKKEIDNIIETYITLNYNIKKTAEKTNHSNYTIRRYVKYVKLYISPNEISSRGRNKRKKQANFNLNKKEIREIRQNMAEPIINYILNQNGNIIISLLCKLFKTQCYLRLNFPPKNDSQYHFSEKNEDIKSLVERVSE